MYLRKLPGRVIPPFERRRFTFLQPTMRIVAFTASGPARGVRVFAEGGTTGSCVYTSELSGNTQGVNGPHRARVENNWPIHLANISQPKMKRRIFAQLAGKQEAWAARI